MKAKVNLALRNEQCHLDIVKVLIFMKYTKFGSSMYTSLFSFIDILSLWDIYVFLLSRSAPPKYPLIFFSIC